MRADVLVWIVQAAITWTLVRGVASLAVSAGAQSLWALAAAVAATVAVAALVTAWLTRTARASAQRRAVRLLPIPLAGAAWTTASVLGHGGTAAQTSVSAGAWVVGGLVALLALQLSGRSRPRDDGAFTRFGA